MRRYTNLEQPFPLQALEELRVADEATAAADRLSEGSRIGSVFQHVQELLIVGKRQHDSLGPAMLIDQELIGCDLKGHGAASLSRSPRAVKARNSLT